MIKRRYIAGGALFLLLALGLAAACNPTATPTPSPTPIPTLSPTPTSTPYPTPTPTLPPTPISTHTADPTSKPDPTETPVPTTTPGTAEPPDPPPLLQLPDVTSVVERVGPSVVSVLSQLGSNRFSSGSGVIFDDQGHILTNNHVIEGADLVTVTLADGQQHDTRVVGADPLTDLAVLKLEGADYPYVPFADPESVRVGQWVIAIGNALGLPGGPSVTVGIVSALDRSLDVQQGLTLNELIQTDTIINPGNSGGPLLNLESEIVGINTAVLRGGNIEGIGFAVSAETAIPVSQELIENGRVRWAWLGVIISDLSVEDAAERNLMVGQGVLVVDVEEGDPASEAGIRPGDVMLNISGHDVPTVQRLSRIMRQEFRAGDKVKVVVWRDNQRLTFQLTLGERPSV